MRAEGAHIGRPLGEAKTLALDVHTKKIDHYLELNLMPSCSMCRPIRCTRGCGGAGRRCWSDAVCSRKSDRYVGNRSALGLKRFARPIQALLSIGFQLVAVRLILCHL